MTLVRGVDHVGILVEDLDGAQRFLTELLGFTIEREFSVPGRVRVVMVRLGDSTIELIDPREARSGPDVRPEQLPRDHLALEVENLDQVVEQLRRAGVETTSDEPSVTSSTRAYFSKPETTHGIALQFVERT